MEQKRVIVIDEESFQDKVLEIMKDMTCNGGPHLSFAAALGFAKLQRELFNPQKELEETEQE